MIWATVSSRSGFYWLYRASPPLAAMSISSFSSVQLLSCAQLFVTPWTASPPASLSITNSWSLLKLMSITLLMPSNHLILCHPLLLPPSKTQNQGLFNESVLHIRWPKYWCFSFSISPSNKYSGLISFRMDWLHLLAVQGPLKCLLQHTVQKHQSSGPQHSLWLTLTSIHDYWKNHSFDYAHLSWQIDVSDS